MDVYERSRFVRSCMQGKFLPPVVLALFTLIIRVRCRGDVYFADDPNYIRCILDKSYIIQPPGYWLFNRTAGLFTNPAIAISVMNILFSVAGVVVFYYTAQFFASRTSAFIAALAYSSIFYIWFSGEIYSTHASQILFPVALFSVLLHYESDKASWKLWLAAVIFAVGAGLRPSDGVFLVPMLLYYSVVRLPWHKAIPFFALSMALCLTWVIPTWFAYQSHKRVLGMDQPAVEMQDVIAHMWMMMTYRSILAGVNSNSMANVVRYFLPLLVAFFPILSVAIMNLARNRKDWRLQLMFLWIVPGSLFFIFSYMGNAAYLNFLSAVILLLAVGAPRRMAVTAAWNVLLFLSVAPIPSHRLVVNVWNCYVVEYSRYGVQHQWWPFLSKLQGRTS